LDDIWLYTARQSGSFEIADKVTDAITGCFVSLGRNPYMGRRRDHDLSPGLRTFPAATRTATQI
jgi:plasmid stabilization system protein ParE